MNNEMQLAKYVYKINFIDFSYFLKIKLFLKLLFIKLVHLFFFFYFAKFFLFCFLVCGRIEQIFA